MNSISTAVEEYGKELVAPLDDRAVSHEEAMARAHRVADLINKGSRSTSAIMDLLGVKSRTTAIKYRNMAMQLLHEERKPMNREALRSLEIGRIEYWIEDITRRINEIDWEPGNKMRYQQYNMLLTKLKEQSELLHKITGVNTEVQVHMEDKRRIVFVRPQQTYDPTSNESNDVIEGEVVASSEKTV